MKMSKTFHVDYSGLVALCLTAAFSLSVPSHAMPPHPDLLDKAAAGKATLPYFITHLDEMHAKGICTGSNIYRHKNNDHQAASEKSPGITGQFKALAILVKFTDHPNSGAASFFDSLLFDSVGNTVADYYDEISYGQLDMLTLNLPSSLGWRTAPQTYAYYVNGQNGTGSYPRNTQKLVEDLVDQIDPLVDFSQYDNDGDGDVDVLIVIHSGTGAEFSGSDNDIWSHEWSIVPRYKDGVYISKYTVQPEFWTTPGDMTIGVSCHELGHAFGLPDLYDTDYSSNGIGKWGIMSYGSWLGPRGMGESPAHPCAWSRVQMGFATPVVIMTNTYSQVIGSVEQGGTIFRLWASGSMGDEYFLVENRQKTGYDSYIPGSGLLVWHIDDAKSGNTQEWWPGKPGADHYVAALEQADGSFELEHKYDYGDANDPFPGGSNKTTFDATTTPSSDAYTGGTSFVKLDNVSSSSDTMYADLIVGFSASNDDGNDGVLVPVSVELSQNYPNPFNPATTIDFFSDVETTARLEVFNLLGQKVRTLLEGHIGSGTSSVTWDGYDDGGSPAASGVYFYRLSAGEAEQVKKMILVR
jgi:immune inhibitor A